ncbi:hypothetical protein ACFO5Q_05140 [Kordiimonas lipolytica]|uniref:PglD N-terminal domain-containing protein n=1 Tax=Kordiimonas lipolytica TaxID=1662421 RepID=A0ABV8U8U9_9PROT|nr:hypothetical protein [Kordiimonas lipolytica]
MADAKRKLVIFGGNGAGMIAASIAERFYEYEILGFLNDKLEKGTLVGKNKQFPVLGGIADYAGFLNQPDVDFFFAIFGMSNPAGTWELLRSLEIPEDRFPTFIHPLAEVPEGYCKIGYGSLVCAHAALSADVTLAPHVCLMVGSFVGHDTSVGSFTHFATNAVAGASNEIGSGVHMGSNSTTREFVTIGDCSMIGAGSVILKSVEPYSVMVGNPARVIRKNSAGDA